jgi:LacI family transcriptional regulator
VIVPSGWRTLIEGVVRYVYPAHQWRVKWFSGWGGSDIVTDAFSQRFDGMIVAEDRRGLAAAIAKGPWKTVLASDSFGNPELPCIDVNNAAIGQIAADYLLGRGFDRLVFCGDPQMHFARQRFAAFRQAVADAGKQVTHWDQPLMESELGQARFGTFLEQMPRPLAVFCESDWIAKHVADICHLHNLRVPEDVAVLGVGADTLICQLTYPPLSTVHYPGQEIGYEAARLLDDLMSGRPAPPGRLLFPPQGITTRASTDILAIDDPDLADALRFIREHAGEPISMKHILRRVPIGRRTLEKKFRRLLGRSPLEEITRLRLETAKLYLASSDLGIPAVAKQCGFADARRFATVFRQSVGCTPTAYRQRGRTPVVMAE